MSQSRSSLLLLGTVAAAVYFLLALPATPLPKLPVPPAPHREHDEEPDAPKRPCPGPRPWPRLAMGQSHAPQLGGVQSPDGSVSVEIPVFSLRLKKNIASRGLGCCGSRSLEYAARNVGIDSLYDLPEQMRRQGIPGGDNPYTIARKMSTFAPGTSYFQDVHSTLEVLQAVLRTQRIACVGYAGHDPHYTGHIDHCVCVVACDLERDWVAILDNNYPADDQLVWMGAREFRQRWTECLDRWVYSPLAIRPGALSPMGSVPDAPGSDSVVWQHLPDEDHEYSAWTDGRQLGNWLAIPRLYYPRLGPGRWDVPTDPPAAPPEWPDYPAVAGADGRANYGIDRVPSDPTQGPTIDGKPVTRAELLKCIGPRLAPVDAPADPLASLRKFVQTPNGRLGLVVAAVLLLMLLFRPQSGAK